MGFFFVEASMARTVCLHFCVCCDIRSVQVHSVIRPADSDGKVHSLVQEPGSRQEITLRFSINDLFRLAYHISAWFLCHADNL